MELKTYDCFYELSTKSEVADELLDWCRAQPKKWEFWQWTTFMMKFPPMEILEKDPLISQLLEDGWVEPLILKNFPHSFYNFHVDRENRPCAVNLQLGHNVNSHTVFLGPQIAPRQLESFELVYKPNTYYLLNTHIPHGIFNFQKERYTLSINPPEKYRPDWWDNFKPPTGGKIELDRKLFKFFSKEFKGRGL